MPDEFYKERFFQELEKRLDVMSSNITTTAKDVADIKAKMSWVFGMAAGVTLVVNVAWRFITEGITKK